MNVRTFFHKVYKKLKIILKSNQSPLVLNSRHKNLRKDNKFKDFASGRFTIGRGLHWTEHLSVRERINTKVSNDPSKGVEEYFIEFLKDKGITLPVRKCLTLGCGFGELERGLSKFNLSKIHDAYDISKEAIYKAKEVYKSEDIKTQINYKVRDINRITLQKKTYDIVFGVMSIHHLEKLERIFSQIQRSLKRDGFLFLNEYIGPSKFQWSDRQLNVVNGLLKIIPKQYRTRQNGEIKNTFKRQSIRDLNKRDPSEAIRSEDIIKVLETYFDILERKDYGGTIIHLLL